LFGKRVCQPPPQRLVGNTTNTSYAAKSTKTRQGAKITNENQLGFYMVVSTLKDQQEHNTSQEVIGVAEEPVINPISPRKRLIYFPCQTNDKSWVTLAD